MAGPREERSSRHPLAKLSMRMAGPREPPPLPAHSTLSLAQHQLDRLLARSGMHPLHREVDGRGRLAVHVHGGRGRDHRRAARAVPEAGGIGPPPGAESKASWSTSNPLPGRPSTPGCGCPVRGPPRRRPDRTARRRGTGGRARRSSCRSPRPTAGHRPASAGRPGTWSGMSADRAAAAARGSPPRPGRRAWPWAAGSSSSGCSRCDAVHRDADVGPVSAGKVTGTSTTDPGTRPSARGGRVRHGSDRRRRTVRAVGTECSPSATICRSRWSKVIGRRQVVLEPLAGLVGGPEPRLPEGGRVAVEGGDGAGPQVAGQPPE